jgi:ribonuclease HI
MEKTSFEPLSLTPSVSLLMESGNGVIAWAVVVSDRDVRIIEGQEVGNHTDLLSRGALDPILASVIQAARALALESLSIVDVCIHQKGAREKVFDLAAPHAELHVVNRSNLKTLHPTHLRVSELLKSRVGIASSDSDQLAGGSEVIVAATDGGYHQNLGGAAFGWITADGRFGFGSAKAIDPFEAELAAIEDMLRKLQPSHRVIVYIDSKNVITAIRSKATFTLSLRAQKSLARIHKSLGKLESYELVWVKGHAGHPLNDGADRLARLARNGKYFQTASVTDLAIARNIATECAAAFELIAA